MGSSIPKEFPISLKPWPASKSVDLPIAIQRINLERGGFRDITEDSLRRQITEEERDIRSEEASTEDEIEEEQPDRLKKLVRAREDILGQIEYVVRLRPSASAN